MGVPALFRWLSKKYPKIILPVVESEEVKVPDTEGNEVAVPIDISDPNPNGVEFDNLYLDMNGIVHPCTHPEGKPAPETEEEMMVEIFKYTERVFNMIRPRRLLFMAIDGVAPRAKMNQQRSRRFRSAQEAREKEDARKESIALWEAMGKTLSEEEKNKKAWDSNAITPGTPFMTLLASSLRYWVVMKMNTDPGWKSVQVIISDASVPGEGEHKIMDFIRRQRSNPGHDPNTRHVIYGLDADLIMLSLATHEPHFRVLREDVFFQEGSRTACRICGQEGHYAAQCTGQKAEIKKTPPEKKPFIFLDVAILREYLEAELNVPQVPFPFNLEQAIDDWVLLIFFVGNDFLPHLPSLEIREGAIDTLLKIWRTELPRMGGYLTNHGQVELARAQIILEGLARREDEIFQRRREAEERQDQNAKRRKIEKDMSSSVGPSPSLNLTAQPTAPPVHSSLPPRPSMNESFAAKADSIGLGGPKDAQTAKNAPTAMQALAGSNRDVVANRRAIRMANMSAAEVLKAQLAGLTPVKPASPSKSTPAVFTRTMSTTAITVQTSTVDITSATNVDVPGLGGAAQPILSSESTPVVEASIQNDRTIEEAEPDEETDLGSDDDDTSPDASTSLSFKVNPDGTVEQEDTVKLWEPGYKERYYRQKFGVEYSDAASGKLLLKGTPSWQWYYPYHFAPFAADFEDLNKMDLKFTIGQPFKPFEQLMGVFPAASRMHIPDAFQNLMTEADSPIIDFYPATFQIDMNGKRMAWQGVALLPFIEEKRLLDAMGPRYDKLTDEEKRRNRWGNNVLFVFEAHSLYPSLEALYGKRKKDELMPINVKASGGLAEAYFQTRIVYRDRHLFAHYPLKICPTSRTIAPYRRFTSSRSNYSTSITRDEAVVVVGEATVHQTGMVAGAFTVDHRPSAPIITATMVVITAAEAGTIGKVHRFHTTAPTTPISTHLHIHHISLIPLSHRVVVAAQGEDIEAMMRLHIPAVDTPAHKEGTGITEADTEEDTMEAVVMVDLLKIVILGLMEGVPTATHEDLTLPEVEDEADEVTEQGRLICSNNSWDIIRTSIVVR
ncbi:5'-3' exoribonuclease 2 [Grifola frondosa]|uniref:5'-3' exoribonuclease 2 n=1 Tax=Grifola frondosa TaxID=5627 RepID=A0A1C7MPM0_GRIFR|nr:5'-3' exoribonuclease 2 [Grifola frondosa]